MPAHAPARHRRLRSLAAAGCAGLVVPLLVAAPASAQTSTTTTTRTAETLGSGLRLIVSLPQENRIQLDISTVSGSVQTVTGAGPEAEALATLIRGSVAGEEQVFPGAEARLPEPREASGPTSALGEGIGDSPLGEFLAVEVADAAAAVTEAPSGTSTVELTRLGLGLPPELAEALAMVLDPALDGLEELLDGLEPLDEATAAFCAGLEPVTVPLRDGAAGVPVLGGVLADVIGGAVDPEAGVVCNLRLFLLELQESLDLATDGLAGAGALFGVGAVSSGQSITTEGARTTAEATSRVADLQVLGLDVPFGDVTALETTSTAALDGATATADVETTAVEAFADPLLELETDLRTVTGDLAGIELDGLDEVLAQLQAVLDGLAGIGVRAGPLDEPEAALDVCPSTLDSLLSGTLEQDGACAAAASAGFGLALVAPTELAGPLGIETDENDEVFPLVAVQFVPTAAVVRNAVSTTTTAAATAVQGSPVGTLPRTGPQAPVAALGLALLAGAALVRRRRTAAEH